MEDEYVNTLEGQKSTCTFLVFSQRGTVKFKTDHVEDMKMWINSITQVGRRQWVVLSGGWGGGGGQQSSDSSFSLSLYLLCGVWMGQELESVYDKEEMSQKELAAVKLHPLLLEQSYNTWRHCKQVIKHW